MPFNYQMGGGGATRMEEIEFRLDIIDNDLWKKKKYLISLHLQLSREIEYLF